MRAKERLLRKRYSPEFKMELVRLALEKEGSVAALARQHNVDDNHPQTHLAGFSGVLQADAEAACWAHARRKIHDVYARTPSALTEEALRGESPITA